ncbi:hypothetical protein FB45DRAFT_159331 [Roridomyces roridus]|uniref:VHS domain-containing protein n=1 Tax=Roridomyces roridus TaxID=1738132 RepID=A0AAD7BFL9_9AGAR|nr:hypothetical protein FB45DRAFT_159331 [Roridomyces roridus]
MPAQPLQAPIFAPAALPFRVAPSSVTLRDKPLPAEPPGSLPLRRDPSPETLRDAPPALNLSPRRTSSRDQSTHPYSRSNEGPLEQAVDDGTPRPRAIFKFQSMKKLFGLGKSEVPTQQTPITTPIHQQFAFNERARGSPDDDRWEFLDSQQTPPAVTACRTQPDKIPDSIHHPSPPQTLRKKAPPPAVNLLNALEPTTQQPSTHSRNQSEKRPSEKGQEKSGGFGGGGPDEEKEKEREHEMDIDIDIDMKREREVEVEQERERERRDEENELTRKIGFLTATASEDWTLALDVCEHASANENNAREAVRALRREFKYGEPAAQAAAARLWAIMLRNSSGTQCTTRKFLDAVEMVLTSARTTPVVRERLMVVLAAAAYASGPKKESGFRGLWRRVKPRDKPEEGVPLDTDDAMFNPPLNALRHPGPGYEFENTNPPVVVYPDGTQTAPENPSGSPKQQNSDVTPDEKSSGKSHRDHFRGILPPDEDTRRLFQECKIGVDNAFQLSEALATATPEELRNPVISEFYTKCVDSQMLIMTQIPWASAGAERSRAARNQTKPEMGETKRKTSATSDGSLPDIATAPVSTYEEELLADLLTANEHLLEAIDLYMDLERVALERETGQRSQMARRDTNEGRTSGVFAVLAIGTSTHAAATVLSTAMKGCLTGGLELEGEEQNHNGEAKELIV